MGTRHCRAVVTLSVAFAGALAAAPAHATLLTFEGLPASTNLAGAPNNPASILTTQFASLGIVFGHPGVSTGVAVLNNTSGSLTDPNAISGLDASGNLTANTAGDIYFRFVAPSNPSQGSVTGALSFAVGDDGGDLDSWIIRAFDLNDVLIDTQALAGNSHQIYSLSMPGIHRIWIQNTTGTTFGYAVDNLEFATPDDTAIPEPTSMILLGMGLAGMSASRRKRPRT